MKYNIQVDKEQMLLIADALELYSRLKIGQLDKISDAFMGKDFDMESLDYCMRQAKIILFPELHESSYYGIYGANTSRDSKLGYDLYKKIRNIQFKDHLHWNVYKEEHIKEMFAGDKDVIIEKVGE